ncbi:MAG: hypothetical protein KBG83_00830 [Bacteroidetes bacterium]|nr:hypothetical protein [Bacteroidota bacterium]
MRIFFHIVKYKILSSLKSTFNLKTVPIVRSVGSALMYGAFAFAAYEFAYSITNIIVNQTHVGLFLYHQFLSMLLFVFFVSVNLGNILVAYSTLYRSPEVGYLMTKPVPSTTVFMLKFFDNFFYSSTTLFLMGLSVLLGYGMFFGLSWKFFVGTMIFVFIPFMFLAACIAVLVLMAIMKLAARFGFRQVMAGIFLLYFFSIYLFFRAMNPVKLVEQAQWYFPNVDAYLSQLSFGILDYFPNSIVASYLYYSVKGNMDIAIPYVVALCVGTLFVFGIVYLVARAYYYQSWLVSLNIQNSARQPYYRAHYQWFDFRKKSHLPLQLESLLKKEFFLFFREATQWIHLLVMVALLGVFVLSASQLNLNLRVPTMQLVTYLALFGFSGFLVASLALRFVFPMIELEGKAFWSIRSSPLSIRKWMTVKIVLGLLLIIGLGELVTVATHIPFLKSHIEPQPMLIWFGIYSTFWIAVTMALFHFGFGGYFASYTERNPIRAASTQGATITFLGMILYLIAIILIVLLPLSQYFNSLYRRVPYNSDLFIIAYVLVGALSLVLSIIGWNISVKSLNRDFS